VTRLNFFSNGIINDIIFRRWLRLLFGGEFSSMDLLVLWDAIFATSPQDFALVNHIFVAMLVLIRIQCKLNKSKDFFPLLNVSLN